MPNDLASTLIRLRSENRLTQQELADAVGITPSQISRYELGNARPRKTVLLRLAKALNVDISELAGTSADPQMRVVIGEPGEPANGGRMLKQAIAELSQLDSEEAEIFRQEARESGESFEDYVRRAGEEGLISSIQKAVEEGRPSDAAMLRVFAKILFGTNVALKRDE